MTSDELRDRIAEVIDVKIFGTRAEVLNCAQAIIDDLGLTVESRLTEYGIDDPGYEYRVVGKWEAEE